MTRKVNWLFQSFFPCTGEGKRDFLIFWPKLGTHNSDIKKRAGREREEQTFFPRSSLTPPVSEWYVKPANGKGSPIHSWLGRPIQVGVSDSAAAAAALRGVRQLRTGSARSCAGLRGVPLSPAGWATATAQASQEAHGRAALRRRPLRPQVARSARFR